MNKQEDFDKVVAHARKQNCKAANLAEECLFRTEDGKKCFIGALIPDNLYNKKFEELTLISVLKIILDKPLLQFEDEIYSFYKHLQIIHDASFVDEWENKFQDFAEEWNLVYTPPTDH